VHLRQYKGKTFRGEIVHEKLHNIVFTGCGLLDRKGADPGAVIKSVANNNRKLTENNHIKTGVSKMETEATFRGYLNTQKVQREIWPMTNALEGYLSGILKKFSEEEINSEELVSRANECLTSFSTEMKTLVEVLRSTANATAAATDDELKKLQVENEGLKKQISDLQKKLEEYEAEKNKSKRKAKALELLAKWEKCGRAFENEEDRNAEIERLASLDDTAFAASEQVIQQLKPLDDGKPKSDANDKRTMRTDAGVEPETVDDSAASSMDKLAGGLQKARQELKK